MATHKEIGMIYRIYSMTKPIIAVAAIKTIEQGMLNLLISFIFGAEPGTPGLQEVEHAKLNV